MIEEEGTGFSVPKGVFYNPNMRFSRSLSSLAVGAIEKPIEICDSFCASGVRGIRYAKENKNVKKIVFVDIEKSAIKAAEKNAKKAKIKFETKQGNISRLVFDITADFLEIDPFGTPSPYLYDGFRVFNPKKTAYLSVTATDVAVLCGGKIKACMKNYHSRPLNNEFTHENGLRILIKKIAEVAAEFNMGIRPLVSVSDRHYLKTVLEVKRSAELAHESLASLAYIKFCPSCGFRKQVEFPEHKCEYCGSEADYAGPLWAGELHDKKFLEKMEELNEKRNYSQEDELAKTISLMKGETGMPPYYYNIHKLSARFNKSYVPRTEELIENLRKRKYKTAKTHFSSLSIKTDAPYKVLEELTRNPPHKH